MKNLTHPKLRLGDKSTGPPCNLPASATSEGTSVQDTLLAFQANHKALVKHVVQVASSLSEVHKQLNQLCTRSILNEKRIDNLEEGAEKMAACIFKLKKELGLGSNEVEDKASPQISAELEDPTSHQISAELDDQTSCQSSAELENQTSHQISAELKDQTSRQISAELENQTNHQNSPEFENQTSHKSSPELEDQTICQSTPELEDQTSCQNSPELEEQTIHQNSPELEDQSSCQNFPELEEQTSLQRSDGRANHSADSHKTETECAETSPTPDVEEKFDSFQVLQHRAEWNKLSSQQYSLASFDSMKYCKPRSPVMQKIQSEEEELQYLQFVADVTNEILTLGLFSNRVLERVFERHVEQNRHHLDENKMRHLLHVLREDLGCNSEGPDNVDSEEMLSFLHQEKPKAGPVHDAVPHNKSREKTARRKKSSLGGQQNQIEHLLQKETGPEQYGTNIHQQCLPEGDQHELHSESVYQCMERSMGPCSSDPCVDGLSSDMDPYSELTQPDGDMDLSSQDHEEKSDATHNLDVSDCTTEPDSDLENLDESTGMEHLERYFADSLSYCKNEDGCPLDLSGGPRANPSKTTLADCESEGEHFFQ